MNPLNKNPVPKLQNDGEIMISTGRNRFDKHWKNESIMLSALLKRLAEPVRTPETQAEYLNMSRDDQGNIKDVGGFVGGTLQNGKRGSGTVTSRSIITLDLDFAPADFYEQFKRDSSFASVCYSTHKHSAKSPRLRLLIPLSRAVTAGQYEAVARMLAEDIGMDYMDPSTFQPSRLMYWPSCSKDAPYYFDFVDAPFLDPDTILDRYLDPADVSEWPTSSKEVKARRSLVAKQADPTEKPGYIGAFCKAYTVPEAIDAFLGDIYAPTDHEDRYTYIHGSTTAGLVIYDYGKFAYSNHGTDPAAGQLCNAFDLVRIHLFGDLDEIAGSETLAEKLPSFSAMLQFAADDQKTQSEYEKMSGVSPDILEKLRELDAAKNYDQNDKGAGRLFSDVFADRNRYCPEWREWGFYDGSRWKQDPGGMQAQQSGKQLSDALMIYAPESGLKEKDRSEFFKYCASLGSLNRRKNMINDAADNNFFHAEILDRDPYMLNCKNGVLNLRDGVRFIDHAPELLLGKLAPVVYDPAARCPTWDRFIDEIMQGDAEKIGYLQRYAGLSLTGIDREETMLILYGPSTRNGKSTFVETLKFLLGDYAASIQPETLAYKKRDTRNASGDIARLEGARLVLVSEPPKGMLFDAAVIKTMTGRDTITARPLYEREREFRPRYKIMMNTNYLPSVNDDTIFTSGRINVLTFDRHFAEAEQDKRLKEKLLDPAELSGILNWAIEGLRMYQRDGLRPPAAVREAVEEYKKANDRIGNYMTDCLEEDPDSALTGKEFFEDYRRWCHDNGFTSESKTHFFETLRRRGIMSASANLHGKHMKNVVLGYKLLPMEITDTDFDQ